MISRSPGCRPDQCWHSMRSNSARVKSGTRPPEIVTLRRSSKTMLPLCVPGLSSRDEQRHAAWFPSMSTPDTREHLEKHWVESGRLRYVHALTHLLQPACRATEAVAAPRVRAAPSAAEDNAPLSSRAVLSRPPGLHVKVLLSPIRMRLMPQCDLQPLRIWAAMVRNLLHGLHATSS